MRVLLIALTLVAVAGFALADGTTATPSAPTSIDWTEVRRWVAMGSQVVMVIVAFGALIFTALTARSAARTANKGLRIASNTAQRQLRAYVLPLGCDVKLGENGTVIGSISFENAGQTPAHQLTIWTAITIQPNPLRSELPVDPPDLELISSTVLRPGGSIVSTVNLDNAAPLNVRELVENTKLAIYVHGHVKYRDIFDKERTTTFRLIYSGPWRGTQIPTDCQEGNEAN